MSTCWTDQGNWKPVRIMLIDPIRKGTRMWLERASPGD